MQFQAGDRLGPYEIVAAIGAGGMGEVYRARDSRLDRDVAIKVLPEPVAGDPERLARFEREAKTLAALNHPNVAQIYGIESAPVPALAMEFVDGEDLSTIIARTAGTPEVESASSRPRESDARQARGGGAPRGLSLDDALEIAGQIALALEAAHEFGIIHRDLKPSNIRVREDGTVKVLDFGLAKALSPPVSTLSAGSSSTITTPAMTHQGVILGTAAYMSPEQARGKPADKRADIWAFGVILYELTTGRRPFDGETVSESLAGVLKSDPDWQPVPPELRRLLGSCLEKDPKKRLRDIGDWRRQLDDHAVAAAPPAKRAWIAWGLAGALAVAAGVLGVIHFSEVAPVPEPISLQIPPPAKSALGPALSVSRDGRRVLFSARGADDVARLWMRDIGALEARPLAGTENAGVASWSPDGTSVVFLSGRTLKRIAIDGGQALPIYEGPSTETMGGAVWSPAGVLIFGGFRGGPIRRIAEGGGTPTALTALDQSRGEVVHGIPVLLPDGRHFLYVRISLMDGNSGIYIGSIDLTPEKQNMTPLIPVSHAAYVRASNGAGYVLYLQKGTLVAHPFDADRLQLSGDPIPVADGVGNFGAHGFFAAGGGAIAYRRGEPVSGAQDMQLTWLDRQGSSSSPVGRPGSFDQAIRLSPRADRVAVMRVMASASASLNVDIWVIDLGRGVSLPLTTDTGVERSPTWSPDGERIVYSARGTLHVVSSRGGTSSPLLDSAGQRIVTSWSPDGKYLLFSQNEPKKLSDIWILPMTEPRTPQPLVSTQFAEAQARFSPDGRWIVYMSAATGVPQVYVAPFNPRDFSESANGTQYSIDGGAEPRWSRNGREIIFEAPDNRIMAVDLVTDPKRRPGTPQQIFPALPRSARWDVTPDGQRFLVAMPHADAGLTPINVVLNWSPSLTSPRGSSR